MLALLECKHLPCTCHHADTKRVWVYASVPLFLAQSGSVEQHRDVLERPCAAAALAGLIAFAGLTGDSSGLGKHQLALYDPGRWVGGVCVCVCGSPAGGGGGGSANS